MAETYNEKGTATHYNEGRIESIVMMERIWGTYEAMVFCEMTAFKYRMRIGHKDDTEQEMKKTRWYETTAAKLKKKIGTKREIKAPTELRNIL